MIWHSEKFGKNKDYHLMKTLFCEQKDIHLIHVFEDEWLYNPSIINLRINEILGNNKKVYQSDYSNISIHKIDVETAMKFLIEKDLSSFIESSSVCLGCFNESKLISVMTFELENNDEHVWKLNQFAYDFKYVDDDIFKILCNYFIESYKPNKIIALADMRWFSVIKKNFFNNFGFVAEQTIEPSFSYVNGRKRANIQNTRHNNLFKIWNCGFIKYVWKMI